VAFLVHRRVFARVGGFDENFRKGGNEDVDFFWRAQAAGFTLATTGASYLHHFGSVTQNALKAERGSTRAETIGYFRAKWKIGWFKRRWQRLQRKFREAAWRRRELRAHGRTLLALRGGGKIIHR
jgi:GT2 family glycosyltransferase